MPVRRKSIPSYLPHRQSGRGRAVWTDASGLRQFRLLPGDFDSAESRNAFATLLLELGATPHGLTTDNPCLTVAELLLAYFGHAERHYRGHDGRLTSEIYEVRVVIRALREMYADKPVGEFGPLCLKAARQRWVAEGRSRTECNRRVAMVKRIFKWAVSEELVPPAVYQAIATVSGLQKGRTAAKEKDPVGPVEDAVVDATVPFLGRHVKGLVEFQRLTGCRPGEACTVRLCDIDTSGSMWLYRPPYHKNAYRGTSRTIVVGPQAQAVLRAFSGSDVTAYLFSPARSVEEFLAERAARRTTKRYPLTSRKPKNVRVVAEKYNRGSYGLAVDRACDRAFPLPEPLSRREDESRQDWWDRLSAEERVEVKAWWKAHRWHPNQLRHSFATRVRKAHGLEAAQVLLGHSRADVTQVYAERNHELAATIAAQIG